MTEFCEHIRNIRRDGVSFAAQAGGRICHTHPDESSKLRRLPGSPTSFLAIRSHEDRRKGEEQMPEQSKEYSLAEVVNDPASHLTMWSKRLDRRSLELLLGQFRQARDQRQPRVDPPLIG
jgi:hypothetical protein